MPPQDDTVDLKAYRRIAVGLGWSYGSEIDQQIKDKSFSYRAFPNAEQMLNELLSGSADAALLGYLEAEQTLKDLKDKQVVTKRDVNAVHRTEKPLADLSIYIAFDKKWKKTDLIGRINTVIQKMHESGRIAEIMASYK